MWPLDPSVTFLNHGSFGVCPNYILERQSYYRHLFESEPVDFVLRHLDELIYRSRSALAQFIHCETEDLVLVPNVTHGVNSILKSYPFQQGDEVLITGHIYNACRIALCYVAKVKQLKIKEVRIRFPDTTSDLIIEQVLSHISPRTRLVFLDHITLQRPSFFLSKKSSGS